MSDMFTCSTSVHIKQKESSLLLFYRAQRGAHKGSCCSTAEAATEHANHDNDDNDNDDDNNNNKDNMMEMEETNMQ